MNRRRGLLPLVALLATLGLYFAVVVPRLIWRDAHGLWVGQEHLWSDWPLHIALLRRFADCPPSEWLAQHPMIGGERLRYPFVGALISGMLVRAGLSVPAAVTISNLAGFALLIPGLWVLWRRALGGWTSAVAVLLFFLGAGPGGALWLGDIGRGGLPVLFSPPIEYGRINEYGWYAGNFVVGMLLPQRAFLPGLALAVWLLVGFFRAFAQPEPSPRRRLLTLCGVGVGLMPIVHVHSLLAVLVIGGLAALGWAGRSAARWGELLAWVIAPGLALGGGLWFALLRPDVPFPNFVSWHPGFVAENFSGWVVMWARFWGVALPLGMVGSVLLVRARRGTALVIGAWVLFALANLILFQPSPWDNSKIFLWAYLGLCGPLAACLSALWRRGGVGKPAAIVVAFALCITGIPNLIALARTDEHRYQILTAGDLELGDRIRRETLPSAIFLTSTDISNAPMVWGARPIYLGFTGWMANFGFAHAQREDDLRRMLTGGTEATLLLRQYGIDYVLIGPGERASWNANEAFFAERYPVFWRGDGKTVYRVR
jgi:hypothetical protein